MARRTRTFIKIPWTGGLNSSVDQGMLPDNDLTIADNVVFAASGARIKRDGREYLDTEYPDIVKRISSGTTRKLVFASGIQLTVPTNQLFVVGEKISVTTSGSDPSGYLTTLGTVTAISTTDTTNDTVEYTFSGAGSLTESATATSTLSVERASAYICVKDYWRTNVSDVKVQLIMALSETGQLFKYDTAGRREQIVGSKEWTRVTCLADTAGSLTGKYFVVSDSAGTVAIWYKVSGTGSAPVGFHRTIEVDIATGTSANNVALATQLAVDADSKFTVSLENAVIIIQDVEIGSRTNGSAGTSGFTVTTQQAGYEILPNPNLTTACMEVMNDILIVAMDGVGNIPIKYHPETNTFYEPLGGNPPDFGVMAVHQSRLFVNDKTSKDYLNCCAPDDPETWPLTAAGPGDSGALEVVRGDGDPVGISAIRAFKGNLFVGKNTKLYRILGDSPDNYSPEIMTEGLGVEAQQAFVAADTDDVYYISKKGVHSIGTTNEYGDFKGAYKSSKIQPTFKTWPSNTLKYARGAYIPELSSVAFAVTEYNQTQNSSIFLFNTDIQEWYRWPDIQATALGTMLDSVERRRLLIGTGDSRIVRAQTGRFTDFDGESYRYRIKTGTIYPDGDPLREKAFKSVGFFFKPRGRFSFTALIKVDNLPVQTLQFEQPVRGDQLGVNFILGTSVLGLNKVLAPQSLQIDGVGRGISIEIQQDSRDQQVEIYGLMVEYEPADISEETLN
jgi:hypothetical protein